MKRRISRRLQCPKDAVFVGLLPGDRVWPIEGFYEWDLGFLTFSPDWLTYTGERTQFSVRRSGISAIAVQKGPIAWDRMHAVVVTCQDGAFVLRRPDAGSSRRQARRLESRLNAWWRGEAVPNQPVPANAPFSPPSLPAIKPVLASRWRVAFVCAKRAGMLFVGTLITLAVAVPMTTATMMYALVPFAAPLAYLLAVGPLLLRRKPA